MIINHNLAGMNAIRNMNANSVSASKAMQKLSTGLRINSAADDAAGLAISEKMRGQIRGLDQASANAQDGISMIQTAEGGLSETHSILQRMRELAVQSSNGTATDADRTEIQKEVVQLKSEIDRISNDTEFNTKKLLNGKMAAAKAVQGTKANSVAFERGAVVATAGNVDGAIASNVSTKAADAGQKGSIEAGTVFDTTNGATIITGMNDQIKITVGSNASGNNSSTLTLAGDTAVNGGKNYATLDAMISHLNSLVDADATLKGKVEFAKNAAGTKLVVKATTVGENVSVSEATAGQGALGAVGLDKTVTSALGTATYTDSASTTALQSKFSVTIGGVTKDIDLQDTTGGATSLTTGAQTAVQLNTALNEHVNYAFFGDKALTKISFGGASAAARTITLHPSIQSDIKNISIFDKDSTQTGAAQLFNGITLTSTTNTNSATYGRDAVAAATIGNVIVAGANDKFKISVDGGTAQTLTLTAKTYADRASLVDEINNQINSNINLKDKVTASLDTDNTIKFISASTGTSSGVVVSAPGTAAESALAALGYKGNTQTSIVGGTYDGDFSTTANAKFEMTVGNLTKTIDFSTASGINSNTSIANAKDAIQTKIDEAFGENVVKVDIENNKLKFTNIAATDTFAIKDSDVTSAAAEKGATKLLGYTASNGVITNGVAAGGALNLSAAADHKFLMTVGSVTKSIDLTAGASDVDATTTQAELKASLQEAFDAAWGAGTFKVTNSATTNQVDIESTLNNIAVSITNGANTGATAIFGNAGGVNFTRMANDSLTLNNTTTDGTAATTAGNVQATTKLVNLTDTDGSNLGLSDGNVITIAGTKDGAGFSSTLAVTATTTMAELVDKMNGMSAFSGGTVSLNDQTGKIEFTGANGKVNDISNLKLSAQISATDTTTINAFNNKAGSFIKTQTAQDASSGNQTTVHIGSNEGQTTTLDINDMSVKALSIDKVDVSTKDGAEVAITLIDNSITSVSSERSKLGALQNRLEHTIANLGTSSENLTSAESRIRDVDMAKEMSTFSKNNILAQAAQAMLAQANQQPQQVLQLLR